MIFSPQTLVFYRLYLFWFEYTFKFFFRNLLLLTIDIFNHEF